ncbi:MAG: B12-binding domain-containing radical SAM protein, partial [Oligoflexia bacterium]|nr:B12-binding domain-containing radical SAM protein [Oligoflexia bacterium]
MRVLLLNPAIRAEQFGRFAGLLEAMPCVGIAYVATFLAQAGHDVRVYDDFAMRGGPSAVLAEIERFRPQVFGASVLTPVAPAVIELMRTIRQRWPDIRMFAGNIHADLFPEEFAGLCQAVVHGEGEQAAVELLAAWQEGRSGQGIAGVTVIDGDKLVRGPSRALETDLDAYPFPDWRLLPYQRYSLLPLGTIARPIVAVAASRGCPFHCTYCALENQGKVYRKRSVSNVVDEIEYDVKHLGVKQIGFMDPIFPMGRRHAIDFSREMIRRGLHERVVWLSELRTDVVDRESLQWMARSGCRRLVFGIESGVDALLEGVHKGQTTDGCRQTIRWCRQAGITTVGLFMIGLPGEQAHQTQQTIDYACSLELDFAKFAITVPFPGSEIYEQMARDGKLSGRDWENYTTFNPDQANIVIVS